MNECERLTSTETAAGRGFTDPARTAHDLAAVRVMLAAVRRLSGRPASPAAPGPLVVEAHEPDGRAHRTIVCDAGRLGAGHDLGWVGFFAATRRDVDAAPLRVRDDELIAEFPAHPGVLSYSSIEVGGGDWGNLILLDGDAAREHWGAGDRHAHAVRELAPRHYTDVRLHLGVLPGGVGAGRAPVLRRTRYLDYRDGVTWRAEREWPA